jgi:hypothetical protein
MGTLRMDTIDPDVMQKAEWRVRLVRAVLFREHDDDTLLAMLDAGLDMAHSEGLLDAVEVCQGVADQSDGDQKRVASVLANALRKLDAKNKLDAVADAVNGQ